MIVSLWMNADARVPVVEVNAPVSGRDHATLRPIGLALDGLPDVIEYKGHFFMRVFDGSHTPRYVKGDVYHAS